MVAAVGSKAAELLAVEVVAASKRGGAPDVRAGWGGGDSVAEAVVTGAVDGCVVLGSRLGDGGDRDADGDGDAGS